MLEDGSIMHMSPQKLASRYDEINIEFSYHFLFTVCEKIQEQCRESHSALTWQKHHFCQKMWGTFILLILPWSPFAKRCGETCFSPPLSSWMFWWQRQACHPPSDFHWSVFHHLLLWRWIHPFSAETSPPPAFHTCEAAQGLYQGTLLCWSWLAAGSGFSHSALWEHFRVWESLEWSPIPIALKFPKNIGITKI